MANYFSAQISQEHSTQVMNLALSLNVPNEQIVFKTQGCPLGSIGIYIKFDSKDSLDEFSEKVQEIPCILKMW